MSNKSDTLKTVLQGIGKEFPQYANFVSKCLDRGLDEQGLRGVVAWFSADQDKPREVRLVAHRCLNALYPEIGLGTLEEEDEWGRQAVEAAFAADAARNPK